MKPIILIISFCLILSIVFCKSSFTHTKNKIKSKTQCNDNCENPVYIISRSLGKTLDIYNDPEADSVHFLYSYFNINLF